MLRSNNIYLTTADGHGPGGIRDREVQPIDDPQQGRSIGAKMNDDKSTLKKCSKDLRTQIRAGFPRPAANTYMYIQTDLGLEARHFTLLASRPDKATKS